MVGSGRGSMKTVTGGIDHVTDKGEESMSRKREEKLRPSDLRA